MADAPDTAAPSRAAEHMTKDEFCARFKARLLKRVGQTDAKGQDVAEYADQVAPSYWEDQGMREVGPEACADEDLSYWEPE